MEAFLRLATLLLGAAITAVLAGTAAAQTTYTATINAAQEVPANASMGTGSATVILNAAGTALSISANFSGLGTAYSASHIHGPAAPGSNGGVRWAFVGAAAGWVFGAGNTSGSITNYAVASGITATDIANLNGGLMYVNIHSSGFPGGEIRGQLFKANVVPTLPTSWGRMKSLYR